MATTAAQSSTQRTIVRRWDEYDKEQTSLSFHKMGKELKPRSRDHVCPLCDAAFGRANDLSRHVRLVHEQRRDHACPQCNAAFGEASKIGRAHV